MGLLFVAFLVMPVLEIWVIIQTADAIGGGWTVVLLVADSIVGAVIVRREGRRAWSAFRQALADGRWPADEVAQGALVLVGGALLLTPGFVTDVIGLSFVLPPTRALIAAGLRQRTRGRVTVIGMTGPGMTGPGPGGGNDPGRPGADGADPPSPGPRQHPDDGQVLDVEVVSIEQEDPEDEA